MHVETRARKKYSHRERIAVHMNIVPKTLDQDVLTVTVITGRTRLGRRESVKSLVARTRKAIDSVNADNDASKLSLLGGAARQLREFAGQEIKRTRKTDRKITGWTLGSGMLADIVVQGFTDIKPLLTFLAIDAVMLPVVGVREAKAAIRRKRINKEADNLSQEAPQLPK